MTSDEITTVSPGLQGEPAMSSLMIADLVSSRHDKVKQSIERLASRGVIIQPPMGNEPSTDSMGRIRNTQVYWFRGEKGKRDSIVVVAQLSPEFTARLVDRWQELEAKQNQPALPQTYLEALEALVESERDRQAAQQEVTRLQQVCEMITDQFKPGMTPPAFCRILNGVNIQKIQGWLVQRGYLLATERGYRAAAPYRDKYFAERQGDLDHRSTEYVTVTLAGAKRLYKLYLGGHLPMKKTWDGQYSHVLFDQPEGGEQP